MEPVRDLPIPMMPDMVRATLREIQATGTGKTETRRVLKTGTRQLLCRTCGVSEKEWKRDQCVCEKGDLQWTPCALPRYRVGDRLYVREHYRVAKTFDSIAPRFLLSSTPIQFIADGFMQPALDHLIPSDGKHRQGMHMCCWMSRITLIVTQVRIQRIQDISEADAVSEGIERDPETGGYWGATGQAITPGATARFQHAKHAYSNLWDSINAEREGGIYSWDSNPFVAAYSFKPFLCNIDKMPEAT